MILALDEKLDRLKNIKASKQELKKTWVADLNELYPEMNEQMILKMAEKALETIHRESEETKQSKPELGADTVEGEVIGND